MDLTGQIIAGRYEVVRLLGEGGMGQVFEARHVDLDKPVAIKFLARDLADNEDLLERFRREARITASLRHANIVEVTDFGVTGDGLPYLVMEYLSGESLSAILEREGPLPVSAARKIMLQVLSGLSEAHSQSIVHRDLKPDNVFLDEVKGHGRIIKILDFGISKMAGGTEGENPALTKTGTVMGTPFYMSPEQVMGNTSVDIRSDIYACGVILFEMLTGRRPFDGETHNEVIVRIMSDPVPDMSTFRPDIDPEIAAITLRAISRDPEKRFASAEDFARALESPDFEGPSVSLTSLLVKPAPVRRRALWIVPVAICAFVLVILIAAVLRIGVASLAPGRGEDTVTIVPRGAPVDATIILDGRRRPVAPFELDLGEDPVVFSVEAPGFVTGRFEVVPDANQQVRIILTPIKNRAGPEEKKAPEKKVEKKVEKKAEKSTPPKKDDPAKKPKKKSKNPIRALIRSLKH